MRSTSEATLIESPASFFSAKFATLSRYVTPFNPATVTDEISPTSKYVCRQFSNVNASSFDLFVTINSNPNDSFTVTTYSTLNGGNDEASGYSGKLNRTLTLPSAAGATSLSSHAFKRAK